MYAGRIARSRRVEWYSGTDEQQKRSDQLSKCNWLPFTQKVNEEGKAACFMETETCMSFVSRRQGTDSSLSERPRTCERRIRNP